MTVSSPLQASPALDHPSLSHGNLTPEAEGRKLVVLTGASGGIGVLIGRDLLSLGYDLIALCRSQPDFDPRHCVHIPCDLTSTDSMATACARIREEKRQIFAVIHCAGTISPSPMMSVDESAIQAQIDLNLAAPIRLTRHLLPLMHKTNAVTLRKSKAERDKGRIIFVNSMAAVMPLADSAIYAASKAGLRSFALSLAQEVRSLGITVSTIFPGAVQTDMLIREMAEGGSVLNYVSTPLSPEKVAKVVIAQLTQPCRERFLPTIDGIFGKLCMLAPPLLRLSLPILRLAGHRGYEKSRRQR